MPAVTGNSRYDENGQLITDFIDSVGTTSVTYTFATTYTSLYIRNDSDVSLTVTVNGSPTVIARLTDATITADYNAYSIVSADGVREFYSRSVRAVGNVTTATGPINVINGTAGLPSISPTSDNNTGIFFPAADTIAFTEGGTEAMRITSAGNVGIGTTSPTNKLQIAGVTANTSCINAIANTTTGQSFGIALSAGTNSNDYAFNVRNAAQTSQLFHVSGDGNVGIGTATPNVYGLEISRATTSSAPTPTELRLSTQNNSSGWSTTDPWGRISFYSADASSGGAKIQAAIDAVPINSAGGQSRIDISTSDGVTPTLVPAISVLSILGLGANVGIGTTNPQAKLHVDVGATTGILSSYLARGYEADFRLSTFNGIGTAVNTEMASIGLSYQGNKVGMIGFLRGSAANAKAITFSTNNNDERMRIEQDGSVGIGTTSPSQKFEVSGGSAKIYGTSGGAWLFIASPDATSGMQFGMNSTEDGNIFHNENKNIIFGTNNISRFILESGGTTRPSSNNTYDLGSATYRWATIYAQNALNTSDARLKTNVEPSSLGLDFIASLNPVQYKWIEGGNTVEKVQTGTEIVEITPAIPAQPEQAEILDEEGNVIQAYVPATEEVPAVTEERPIYEEVITPREGVRTHFGLIAQEVKAALPDGLDFAGWCLADKDDADSTQSLGYTQLIAPMIKAIQELTAKVEALEAQLNGN